MRDAKLGLTEERARPLPLLEPLLHGRGGPQEGLTESRAQGQEGKELEGKQRGGEAAFLRKDSSKGHRLGTSPT